MANEKVVKTEFGGGAKNSSTDKWVPRADLKRASNKQRRRDAKAAAAQR